MKTRLLLPLLLVFALGARAEVPKTYQVTGPIVALTDSIITIQKGDEKWEIARTPATKTDGSLAVGNKVTVHYTMTADSIEAKADKPSNKAGNKKK